MGKRNLDDILEEIKAETATTRYDLHEVLQKTIAEKDLYENKEENSQPSANAPAGATERELRNISEKELSDISVEAVDRLRKEAIEENHAVQLSWIDKDGNRQELKIVPETLESPTANAMKDGDDRVNYYINGTQTTKKKANEKVKEHAMSLSKSALRDTYRGIKAIVNEMQKATDRGVAEFGR